VRNERGFITVDFIFSIVLVIGFTALLFIVTFTLSVASITQYITFAAARNYAVAHLDKDKQEERARAKYKELIGNSAFKPLYAGNWFKVSSDSTINIGDQTKFIPGFQEAVSSDENQVNEFWGVGTTFVAKVLDFKIPFFGSTAPDSDGSGKGFQTYMGSYLGREPSADECIKFNAARWEAIRNLPVTAGTPYSQAGTQGYYPMTDDGC
jgi:hypothetical protein